jgi:hypothetical protein
LTAEKTALYRQCIMRLVIDTNVVASAAFLQTALLFTRAPRGRTGLERSAALSHPPPWDGGRRFSCSAYANALIIPFIASIVVPPTVVQ